jgi:capsid protein
MNPGILTRVGNGVRAAWNGIKAAVGSVSKAIFGHYEGARNQPYRSYVSAPLQSARLDLSPPARRELQKKSRYWERNNALVQRLVDLFEQYTVGIGIGFYPASDDVEWNQRARAHWVDWEPVGDFVSLRGFNSLQQLAARRVLVDGEALFLLTQDDEGNPKVQMLESDQCETPPDRQAEEGISIIDGVAIDSKGRPTGYWIGEDVPGALGQKTWRLIPKEFIVHIFEPSRPGLYRGEPMLHAVLNDIHDLDDLQLTESKAARDGSQITNVIKNKSGTADVGEALYTGGLTPEGAMTQAQKRTYYESTVGGRTFFLQHEDEIEQLKVERPSGATRDYWQLLEEKICAGVGIPRQMVYSGSLQGTVQRSVLDIAAAWFRIRSAVFVRGFAQIYYYVLEHGIKTDRGLADPPATWRRFVQRPPRAPNVDVGRNSYAMLRELAAGATNYRRIFAEMGLDYVEELKQRADEVVLLDSIAAARGITPDRIAAQDFPSADAPMNPEDEMTTQPDA